MAGKTSTLTWTAPPNGGSPITGYRVLVFEASTLVSTLTSATASVSVTASETVDRTALIQARNDQGYSVPLSVAVPKGSAPTTTPTTPIVAPVITATASAGKVTIAASSAGSGYTALNLTITPANNDGTATFTAVTLPYDISQLTNGTAYSVQATATADTRSATSNTVSVTPLAPGSSAPVLTATASGNAFIGTTVTLSLATTGTYTSTDLYRNDTLLKTAATFPYSDVVTDAGNYTYQVYAYNGATLTKSTQYLVTVGTGNGTTAVVNNYNMTTYAFNDTAEARNFQLDRSRADVTNGLLNVRVSAGQGLLGAAGTITTAGDNTSAVRMEVNGFVRSSYAAYGLIWAYGSENNFWFLDGATYGYYETGTRHEVATITGTQPQTLALELDANGTTRIYYGTTLKATFQTTNRYGAFYGVWGTTPFTVDTFKIGTQASVPIVPPSIGYTPGDGKVDMFAFNAGSGYDTLDLLLSPADKSGKTAYPNITLPYTVSNLTNGTTYSFTITSKQGTQSVTSQAVTSTPAAAAPALTAPVIAASRSGATITVTQTQAGTGSTGSILYRDGAVYNQPAVLPFTETSNDAHTYYVQVSNASTTKQSNTVSVAAYAAPSAATTTTYTFNTDADLAPWTAPIDGAPIRQGNRIYTYRMAGKAGLKNYSALLVDAGTSTGATTFRITGWQDNAANGGLVFSYADENNFWYLVTEGRLIGYCRNGGYNKVGDLGPYTSDMTVSIDANNVATILYDGLQAFQTTMTFRPGSKFGGWGGTDISFDRAVVTADLSAEAS